MNIQYLTVNTVPYKIDDLRRESVKLKYSLIVEKVISNLIDEATLHKIEQYITLSLYDLIIPSENFRTGKIPRPQNSYIIYRRNFQAELALSDASNASLNKVSKITSNDWKKEPREIRRIFDLLAECAKEVHKCIFPDYVYNPKKHATTNIPMPPKNKHHFAKNVYYENSLRAQFSKLTSQSTFKNKLSRDSSPISSSKFPLTLEVKSDFMKSFDEKICKKFVI